MKRVHVCLVLLVGGVTAATNQEATFIGARARYWAYQPVTRPHVPPISDPWVRTPIDAFIRHALREKNLAPSPPVDRTQLIRRVT